MTVEDTLAALVDRFNRHTDRSPGVREELRGLERTIAIRLTDLGEYSVELRDGRLVNLRSGHVDRPSVTITTDSGTFDGLIRKEIGPMKALVTRRLVLDGSLEDKLLFRKLL